MQNFTIHLVAVCNAGSSKLRSDVCMVFARVRKIPEQLHRMTAFFSCSLGMLCLQSYPVCHGPMVIECMKQLFPASSGLPHNLPLLLTLAPFCACLLSLPAGIVPDIPQCGANAQLRVLDRRLEDERGVGGGWGMGRGCK